MKLQPTILGICLAALLGACGGSGGDAAPTAPPAVVGPSFPLKSAYSALTATAFTKSFAVSGTCSGTASFAKAAAVAGAVFQSTAGLSEASSLTLVLNGCTIRTSSSLSYVYYDASYTPVGITYPGSYAAYLAPASIPASVVVGDVGTIGTANSYQDFTKSVALGKDVLSYIVEGDSASTADAATAIVNLVTKHFDATNVLTSTTQVRYRIGANGALTLISIDIEGASGARNSFIFLNSFAYHLILQ